MGSQAVGSRFSNGDHARASMIAAIMELNARYVSTVDDPGRLNSWPDLFSEERPSYVVTTRHALDNGHEVAIIMDDTRGKIADRVAIIQQIWEDHYDFQDTTHTVGLPLLLEGDDSSLRCDVPFAMEIVTRGTAAGHRISGQYQDVLTWQNDALVFQSRLVVLNARVLPTYFVRPI